MEETGKLHIKANKNLPTAALLSEPKKTKLPNAASGWVSCRPSLKLIANY